LVAALAVDEPIDGRVWNIRLGRKLAEGNLVSLAEARERVHAGMLPKRQEKRKPYPAAPAVVMFRPSRQNAAMGKGRTKQLPIADDNRVYELRVARGWTQEQLAERIGVAGTTVQRAESGQRGLSKTMRAKLAQVFEISQSELFAQPKRYGTPHEEEAAQLARYLTPEEREVWLQTGRAFARRLTPAKPNRTG
jgi:transcriptional regulator with XRE-family HTH domain